MEQKFIVFRVTEKFFYDLTEWHIASAPVPGRDPVEVIAAAPFDTYDEAAEWIRDYAPVTDNRTFYIPMPVFIKTENPRV